jgi:L-malate glycosyltransferase
VRILVLAHAPSVHTVLWARALSARGHQIRLLSAEPGPPPGPFPVRVVGWPLPIRALRYASARGAVRDELRLYRPDVTVAHFLPNYGFLAALAGARPWMLVCWGSDLLVNARRTPLHRARARWTLRSADLIHVDAEVLARAAMALGASSDRIWTRAWGTDVAALAPAEPWPARRARSEALRILWTRQLEDVYEPETFVRALGSLARRGIAFEATLAGSGPLRSGLDRLARREGIADRLSWTGWVDRSRLVALYRSHHAYVSLSRSDSTSQSLLEAMAAGLVPVVTDIDGNLEWVRHRREGLLVPVGDEEAVAGALAEVARDPEAAERMAASAHAVARERANLADTVDGIERRLEALAGRGASRPRLEPVP